MLKRFLRWITVTRNWNREHRAAWADATEPTESGLSPLQVMCETAIVNALGESGISLVDRQVIEEFYVKARLDGTGWTLWIYPDAAELTSEETTLARLEEWDARTPQEFVETFATRVLAELKKH